MVEIRNPRFYNAKYKNGGWNYDPEKHGEWLKKNLVDRFGLSEGDKLLDLGSGMGLHSALLAGFGLKVYGVELSPIGVKAANARCSAATFINASAADLQDYFVRNYFDVIFVRGMSWYHYELDCESPRTGVDIRVETEKFMKYLKPGGLFVLQIKSNFSGDAPDNDVHENRLSSYLNLFSPLGDIVHVSNWDGVELTSDEQAAEVKGGMLIATRKQ